jgi:RHS repeat-associated protein
VEAAFGLDGISEKLILAEQHIYGSARIGMRVPNTDIETASVPSEIFEHFEGERMYELTNHLGNVLSTVSDSRVITQSSGTITSIEAVLVSYTDYYPFGSPMPGRQGQVASAYRYGFQNQEIDKELWNGAVSYKYRIEDPRLGRFFSVDPLIKDYPYYSAYSFSGNRVMDMIELEGLEPTSIYTRREKRSMEKYKRKETKLFSHLQNADGSSSSNSIRAMNEEFGDRDWYYLRPEYNRGGDRKAATPVVDLILESEWTMPPAVPAPPPPAAAPGMIPFLFFDVVGTLNKSAALGASGNLQVVVTFSAGDQSANFSLFQGNAPNVLGTRLMWNQVLSGPGAQNSPTVVINIANGNFITLVRNNTAFGVSGGGVNFGGAAAPGVIVPAVPPPAPVAARAPIPRQVFIHDDGKWGRRSRTTKSDRMEFQKQLRRMNY